MARYLDPKNDLIFKRIFGGHPHLLKSFLNALMPLDEGQLIEEVEYLSPENIPDNPLKKFSIVDVRCRDNRGRKFIVEMQMQWSDIFPTRMLYNVSHTYTGQLRRGESYGELQPVYGLGILNEVFDRSTPEYYHRFMMTNPQNVEETIGGIEIVMVELPKFRPETSTDRRMAVLWLRFLKETRDRTTVAGRELLADEEIRQALEICEEAAYSESELAAYEHYWMEISNEVTLLNNSKKEGLKEGLEKGLEKGEAIGLEKGEAIGLEKGRAEGRREVARNLLKLGVSPEDIAKSTGLSKEEIAE